MAIDSTRFSLSEPFRIVKNDDDSTSLEGFAIHGGTDDKPFIVNGLFKVPEEEMVNCAKSLKNSKLMKNHDQTNVDSIIGLVKDSSVEFDSHAEMQGVKYSADLMFDETSLQEKIEKGLIDATSIGFQFVPWCDKCGKEFNMWECEHWLTDEDFAITTKDMEVFELSLVPFGADPYATVGAMSAEDFTKEFQKMKEEFIMSKNESTSEFEEQIESLTQDVQELEEKLQKQDADFKQEIEELKLSHQEEVLTLKQEKSALEEQLEQATEELGIFRAEAEAKKEEILAAKKEKLLSLAKELKIEEDLDDVDEMSEEFLDKQIAMFERIIENTPKVGEFKQEQTDKLEQKEEPREAFSSTAAIFYNTPSMGIR